MESLFFQNYRGAAGRLISLFLIALVFIPSGCKEKSKEVLPAVEARTEVTVEELHDLVTSGNDIFLLDVRTQGEFIASRLEFADNCIPYDSLKYRLDDLPADNNTEIYCFCRSGNRSRIASTYLRSQGFKRAYNVTGGILAWKKAGYPVVSGK